MKITEESTSTDLLGGETEYSRKLFTVILHALPDIIFTWIHDKKVPFSDTFHWKIVVATVTYQRV